MFHHTDKASGKVSDVSERVSWKATDLSDKASEKASDLSAKASGKASELSDRLSGKAADLTDKVSGKAADVYEKVAEKASDISERVTGKAADVYEKVSEKVSDVSSKARDFVNNAPPPPSGPRVIFFAGRDAAVACASFVALVASSLGAVISNGFVNVADFVAQKKAVPRGAPSSPEKARVLDQTISAVRYAAASAARLGASIFSVVSILGASASAKVRTFMSTNGNRPLTGTGCTGANGNGLTAGKMQPDPVNAARAADPLIGAHQRPPAHPPTGVAATDVSADMAASDTRKGPESEGFSMASDSTAVPPRLDLAAK